MGIVGRLARPKGMDSAGLEKLIREHFCGGATASGIAVSNESAMRLSTVYSCINIISRSLSQLPCHLMMKTGNKKSQATDHHVYSLLHDQPNEWMTAPEFWGMAGCHLPWRGNFFALKNRGLNRTTGPVKELIPLAPGIVQEVKQDALYHLTYVCKFPDGSNHDIPGTEIMHLRGMVMNGFMGVNPIQYVRETIGLGLAAKEFGGRFFGEGTHPGMVITHPGQLSDPKKLRDALSDTYAGLGKTHRIMLLEEGMKAERIVIDPKDSQFLELLKFNKSEIVDIFFAMPLTLFHSGEATPTFASSEQFSLSYIVYALMPWIVNIEKAIARDLLSEEDRKTYYAKFAVGALLRGSMAERSAFYREMVNAEIMNPNECRDLEDLNPYDGGEVFRTRTSTVKEPTKEQAPGGQQ